MYNEGGIVTAINACYTTAFEASVFVRDYGENEKKTISRLAFASFCPKIMSIYIHQSLIGSIFCCICDNIIYILTEKYIHLCLDYTWANEMKEKKILDWFVNCSDWVLRYLLLVLPGSCMLYWYFSFIGRYHFTAFTCICSHFIGYC